MESRVYLRGIESSDYQTTFQWRNDEEIFSMVGGQKYYVTIEKEKRWAEQVALDNNNVRLMVCLKDGDKPIGIVSLTDINYVNRTAHSHILLGDKSSWGRGYGTEALRQLLTYAFDELGMNRVEAQILDTNAGSIRMHQKCGYVEEGIKRESIYKQGKYHNQLMVAVLKKDYAERNIGNQ